MINLTLRKEAALGEIPWCWLMIDRKKGRQPSLLTTQVGKLWIQVVISTLTMNTSSIQSIYKIYIIDGQITGMDVIISHNKYKKL